MAASIKTQSSCVATRTGVPRAFTAAAPKPARKPVVCRSFELIAAAGDVDAPVAVPIVAALVVTAVVTAVVPAYLNRGQEAADKIFSSKEKNPIDKKQTGKKTTRR